MALARLLRSLAIQKNTPSHPIVASDHAARHGVRISLPLYYKPVNSCFSDTISF
jgi:hypothetical protein